ncbi:hypothetical protein B0H10DRAFT_2071055 [Mycena sp. CBHHK59/15]|nr:hypothetical protein B0H10DRAFT_2071055 [Mycena sp. CBHHK59/15]
MLGGSNVSLQISYLPRKFAAPGAGTRQLLNTMYTVRALVALVFLPLTWFDVWTRADVVRVGNHPELVLSMLAAATSTRSPRCRRRSRNRRLSRGMGERRRF